MIAKTFYYKITGNQTQQGKEAGASWNDSSVYDNLKLLLKVNNKTGIPT